MSILEEMYNGSNQPLNERPYSRTQSAIDAAKGKAKSFVGSGQVEQGAKEVGVQANAYWSEFKRYLGRKYGKSPSTVPYKEVAAFFQSKGLDAKTLGNNENAVFDPKSVGTALLKATREQMNEYPVKQDQPSDDQPQQQSNPQPAQSNTPASNSGLSGSLTDLTPEQREELLRLLS